MKPPICVICHKRFDIDEGGLVYFMKRPADIEWEHRMKETGGHGHPPCAAWFCGKHYESARTRSHLTIDKAIAAVREEMGGV
ncbi:MAG: hypothetical protein JW881_06255 [Spirochaetales bacterium]|nr:hypothetical protein [Spirochaetales bacterium]